ncbi:hypothetical protein ACS0TY_035053 [Phlomoides rotata]
MNIYIWVGENGKPRRKNKGGEGGGEDGLIKKRKLSEEQRKDKLAAELGLDLRQVVMWFQNRRARWKSKKLEEEYNKLMPEHESTVVEKCCLESQVLSELRKQLAEEKSSSKKVHAELENHFKEAVSKLTMCSFSNVNLSNSEQIFYDFDSCEGTSALGDLAHQDQASDLGDNSANQDQTQE